MIFTLASGCAADTPSTTGGGVAIYLTADSLNGAQILKADVSKVKLQAKALIAPEDILAYQAERHEMKLSARAIERIGALNVPMHGLAFVVTAGGEAVYGGAFWSYLSSLSYDGITIYTPILSSEQTVTIGRGYPVSMAAEDDDPRSDPRVLDRLRQAGVLVE